MSTQANRSEIAPTHNRVLDVSDLRATRAEQYAREAGDVYFERKAGRTFLVTE